VAKQPRNRQLEKSVVRTLCEKKGIYTVEGFELAFYQYLLSSLKGQDEDAVLKNYLNTPTRAWNGEAVGVRQAEKLADFFGYFGDYTRLQTLPSSRWQYLITSKDTASFIKPKFESCSLALYGEVQDKKNDKNLREIPISVFWRLEVCLNSNESLFVALRSDNEIHQLAPASSSRFSFEKIKKDHFGFPGNKWLNFPIEFGLGFREIIAIKSQSIPIHPKGSGDPTSLSQLELDLFANALISQDSDFQLARYPFWLVAE
jgi:hypothetical protein